MDNTSAACGPLRSTNSSAVRESNKMGTTEGLRSKCRIRGDIRST